MAEAASRPTLEAVAALAGVSRATVSRVVNGGDGVREPLAERVRQAVAELGYVPNQAARSLVTKRHDAVAVVIAEPETRVFADPFFALQLRGISKELTAHDNQLVLLLTEGRDDHTRVARYLSGGHVDGALVFSLHLDDPLPGLIHDAGVPTVFGGRPGWGEEDREAGPTRSTVQDPGVVYVDCDNRGGARAAVRHLVDLGRRRIAHITGVLDQTSAVDRLDGYRDVMAEVPGGDDPRLVVESDFTPAGGERAMRELLDRCPDVDAVFAANDLTALGALRVLRASGRRVPEDVAVIGFDDMLPVAEEADPPLTTVRQDIEGMGRLMARLLLRGLSDGRDRSDRRDGADGRDRMDACDRTDGRDGADGRDRMDACDRTDRRDGADGRDRSHGRDRTDRRDGTAARDRTETRDRTHARSRTDARGRTEGRDRADGRDRAGTTAGDGAPVGGVILPTTLIRRASA